MKKFYIFTAGAVVVTVLSVLFVPGVDDYVERTFQIYLGRAATYQDNSKPTHKKNGFDGSIESVFVWNKKG